MQQHIENSQRSCRIIFFLSVRCCTIERFANGTQQQRTGSASGVVNGCGWRGKLCKMQHLSHNTTHFGRSIELTFALATLGCKVFHEILISIAKNIIVSSAVFTEIKVFALKSCNQIAQCFAHLFWLTEFWGVVEVGQGKASEKHSVSLFDSFQLLVDLFAYMVIALQQYKIRKPTAIGDSENRIFIAFLVR